MKGPDRGADRPPSRLGAKHFEVPLSLETACRFLHRSEMKTGWDVEETVPLQNGANRVVPDLVPVPFALRAETGVKLSGCGGYGENSHILREERVKGFQEGPVGQRGSHRDMSHLPFRVDPRVGPPSPNHRDPLSQQAVQSLLQVRLNGPGVLLSLPAGEISSVVNQGEF